MTRVKIKGTACSTYNVNHCLPTVQTVEYPQPWYIYYSSYNCYNIPQLADNACIYYGHRAWYT